jgi:DNA-binding MarR family transcriptional regulator
METMIEVQLRLLRKHVAKTRRTRRICAMKEHGEQVRAILLDHLERPRSTRELAELMNVSVSSIQKHLRSLKDAGLLKSVPDRNTSRWVRT